MRFKTDKLSGWVNFEEIEKQAAQLRKKDPTLTKEQAVSKAALSRVWREDRDLRTALGRVQHIFGGRPVSRVLGGKGGRSAGPDTGDMRSAALL